MTVALYDLQQRKANSEPQSPSEVLLLPFDSPCYVSNLKFSSDGRFLIAAVIVPNDK
jgi:hypothetical protein